MYAHNSARVYFRNFKGLRTLAVLIAIFTQDIIALGLSLASLSLALFPPTFGSLFWKLSDHAVAWSVGIAALSVVPLLATGTLTPETSIIPLPIAVVLLSVFQGISRWRIKRELCVAKSSFL